jgi:hypothetical protein
MNWGYFRWQAGVAALIADAGLLLLELLELRLRRHEDDARLVEIGGRTDAAVEQGSLAIVVGLTGGDALLGQRDLLAEARQRALEALELASDARELGLGLLRGER